MYLLLLMLVMVLVAVLVAAHLLQLDLEVHIVFNSVCIIICMLLYFRWVEILSLVEIFGR